MIVNTAAYQSAQAIAAKAQEMFDEAKQIAPQSAAITKVSNDLVQLKNDIDVKTSYDKVNAFVENTLNPDIKAAFKL
jgi:hypothetical protein